MKKVIVGIVTVVLAVAAGVLAYTAVKENNAIQNAGIPKENVTQVEAPEQTVSTENPAFVKEEYVAEIPEGTNIAPNISKIESNGVTGAYNERKTIDGDTAAASYWEGKADSWPSEITLSYDEAVKVHALRLLLNPDPIWGKRIQEIELQTSMDGENFETLVPKTEYQFDPNTGNQIVVDFDETEFTSFRLVFYSNTGAHAGQAAEIELYSNN